MIIVNVRNEVFYVFNFIVVFYLYLVNGFYIFYGIYLILEDVEIFLNLFILIKMFMGQIEVIIDFGDGNNNIIIFNGSDDIIIINGFLLKYFFFSVVNYIVFIILIFQINLIQILLKFRIFEFIYGIEVRLCFICINYIQV